jgi:hypothetical protein
VLIVVPDETAETTRDSLSTPVLGSLIASTGFDSKEIEMTDFPPQDRPPATA